MQIKTHKHYEKAWVKLNTGQQKRVLVVLKQLINNPCDPKLRLHQLRGEYYPQYSFSVGGDLRVHYLAIDATTIVLVAVGTHSQLYK